MTHQYLNREWESDGSLLQKQMENAHEPGCKIPRSTLHLDDLDTNTWIINRTDECLPSDFLEWIDRLGLPKDSQDDKTSPYKYVCLVKRRNPPMTWVGRVGQGVIFLDVIARARGNECYISDLTKIAYDSYFPLNTLSTRGIAFWSPDEYTWESSSTEFKDLIGGGIGKCVASFILAAYGQGVKRIARVTTWRIGHEMEMLFFIEDVA